MDQRQIKETLHDQYRIRTPACHKQDDFEEEEEKAIFFYHRH